MAEMLILAATTAGASAGTAATIGTVASSVGTILSVGSAVSSIAGGMQANQTAKIQARQLELAGRQEELKGRDDAVRIKQRLNAALASQNAIFGARGLAPSGTPTILRSEASNQASQDIELARFNAGQSASAMRTQALQVKQDGKGELLKGFGSAATSVYSLVK